MLDTMGIPARVAPPILMHEVYDLCKNVNPFLTYENAKKLVNTIELLWLGKLKDKNVKSN